jgi:hypothetical protein
MEHLPERLLGYDARVMPPPAWDPARREQFLYRTDAEQVLSTDEWVWPRPFDTWGEPVWTGPNHPIWSNLDELTQACRDASRLIPMRYDVLAISFRFAPIARHLAEGPWPHETLELPEESKRWTALGWDVSDAYLLSGLCNCGLRPEERVEGRAHWETALNHYHLFTDEANATEFAEWISPRVREHAPFFPYRLWLIEGDIAG